MLLEVTFRLAGFEQNANQFWHIEVSCIMEGVHVGPATAQTHISSQSYQLIGQPQRCLRIT